MIYSVHLSLGSVLIGGRITGFATKTNSRGYTTPSHESITILCLLRGTGGLSGGFIGLCLLTLLQVVRLLLRVEDHFLLLPDAINAGREALPPARQITGLQLLLAQKEGITSLFSAMDASASGRSRGR